MAEPTEDILDIPYEVDDFATPDEPSRTPDPDEANKSVLEEVVADMEADIATHNSFDVLHLPVNATNEQKIAVYNEIAIHKGLAVNLEKYKLKIADKVKELK